MNKISKYLLLILCGCEVHTPLLPPIDQQSFSYEELMQQQKLLKEEISRETKQQYKPV